MLRIAAVMGLFCAGLLPAQNTTATGGVSMPAGRTAGLPDAPSASMITRSRTAQNRSGQLQSWWLVAPLNAPYRPLSPREKFKSFVHHTFSPYTLAGAAYDATWNQAWGDPADYGGGFQGWGKRLGAAVADTESRSFFGVFLFPTLLHQDPRYFAMNSGSVPKRVLHAVARVFVTRADDGRNVFNSSGLLGIAFTEGLSMAWSPERKRSPDEAFTRMLGAVQSDATGYFLREFTPDFLRIFKRHAPKSLKDIEQKIPSEVTGDDNRP